MTKKPWIYSVCGLLAGLLIGFVAGREYLKYELAEGMKSVGKKIAASMGPGPGPALAGGSESLPAASTKPAEKTAAETAEARRMGMMTCEVAGCKKDTYGAALDFTIVNATGKDVASFTGSIVICDASGQRLQALKIERTTPVTRGESFTKSGSWPVDAKTFELLFSKQAVAKVKVLNIRYADGTQEAF